MPFIYLLIYLIFPLILINSPTCEHLLENYFVIDVLLATYTLNLGRKPIFDILKTSFYCVHSIKLYINARDWVGKQVSRFFQCNISKSWNDFLA